MRLAQLQLIAYGPFRGLDLDLSAPGLHVVFGRNEAGKSTTLRAITGLLYGIDVRTRDAHVHKTSDLRIGGTLAAADGTKVRVQRRKGASNTLLDESGQPIDEAVLLRLLRGVTEDTFRHAFGLDHETLARGAQALLEGKGDVGGSLFDASVGNGEAARALLQELETEAESLYKARGSTAALNVALKAFAEAQKNVKERQSLPEAYTKQVAALEEATAERTKKAAERAELALRRAKLVKTKTRLPLEKRKERLTKALAELGAIPKSGDRIASLHARLAVYDAASRDRRTLATDAETLRASVADATRRAGLPPGRDAPALDERTAQRIRGLVDERLRLEVSTDKARVEIERAERDLARLRAASASSDARGEGSERERVERTTGAIARALETARSLGDAGSRLASETAKVTKRRAELDARIKALRVFIRPAAELVALELPTSETVDRLLARATELDRLLARHDDVIAKLETEAREVVRQIAEQSGDFAPPDASALKLARAARDAAWLELRRGEGKRDAAARLSLEAELERTMREADALADRMIVEADRVTSLARHRARGAALASHLEEARAAREATRAERSAVDEEHRATWSVLGAPPLAFAEMRGWLDRHARVVEAHGSLLEAELDAESSRRAMDDAREGLANALAEAGENVTADAAFGELIAAAASRLERAEAARAAATETARALTAAKTQLEERRLAFDRDDEALRVASTKLHELARPLGLPDDVTGREILQALDALKDLFALEDKRAGVAARAAAADADAKAFEEEASRAAIELAPDLVGLPARDIATSLANRSQSARADAQELATVESQLEELGDATLDAGDTPSADPEAVQRAIEELDRALSEIDDALQALDRNIGGTSGGLRAMGIDSGAAEASAQAQAALARVRSNAERYLRAKIAAVVLAREIERYREQNQGPMLTLASQLFARLTLGRYTGVRTGFDDKDRQALRCIRHGTTEVDVAGLSEGTRDQLYLSLRLASLLRHAETAEPMPLVLDDVLVQFDDERSRAALTVLAEVAKTMQVLFFTHHARVVELAREAVPAADLVIHELATAPAKSLELFPEP